MTIAETKNRTIRGITALISRTIFLQSVSLISFFLLGIFLSPAAVGVFIVVSALLRIFTLFTDLGLGAALIQKKEEPEKEDLETTFTIQELLVIASVVSGFLLIPVVSKFARLDQSGVFLYQVLLVTLFISSLKVIPSLLLERKLAFETQVIPQIVESVAFNIIVVVLAYRGWGIASYAWAILISALVGLPIYYLISPWKISVGISRERAKRLLSYGIAYQGKSVLAIIKDDLLTFFLAGLVGPAGVGYWGWAQRWSYSPFRLIVDSVTKVTFPAYSRIQHKTDILRAGIEKSLFAVSAVLFPMLMTMAVFAGPVIRIIPKYAKWEPALPSFYFLCAGAAVSALSNILVNALDATGRVKTTLRLMILWIVLTWVLTIGLVAKFGFTGISVAAFFVSLTIMVTIYLVKEFVSFSFFGSIVKPLFCSLVLGTVLWLLLLSVPHTPMFLVIVALAGGIIYLSLITLLAGRELKTNLWAVLSAYRK